MDKSIFFDLFSDSLNGRFFCSISLLCSMCHQSCKCKAKKHFKKVTKKMNYGISTLRQMQGPIPTKTMKMFLEGLINCHIRHCETVYLAGARQNCPLLGAKECKYRKWHFLHPRVDYSCRVNSSWTVC